MDTFGDLGLHPLATAVLRYYMLPQVAAELGDEETFLRNLSGLLDRLPSQRVVGACEHLLVAARFLNHEAQHAAAFRIAEHVRLASLRTTARAGGAAALKGKSDMAQVHMRRIVQEQALPVAPAPSSPAQERSVVKQRWGQMSDARKQRLAEMADAFLTSAPRR